MALSEEDSQRLESALLLDDSQRFEFESELPPFESASWLSEVPGLAFDSSSVDAHMFDVGVFVFEDDSHRFDSEVPELDVAQFDSGFSFWFQRLESSLDDVDTFDPESPPVSEDPRLPPPLSLPMLCSPPHMVPRARPYPYPPLFAPSRTDPFGLGPPRPSR